MKIEDRTSPLTLALLGDIHCFTRRIMPWQLFSKRILGALNVWFGRGNDLRMDVLPHVCACIADMRPDVVLSPGDVTMTALEREFDMATAALRPVLDNFDTFMVAGNHDRYTFSATRNRRFEHHFARHTVDLFPHHRELKPGVHLVAIDTSKPNVIGDLGRAGAAQLDKLRTKLAALPAGEPVIVLGHYTIGTPPGDKGERASHRLVDEAALIETLKTSERELLYVHGHVHRPWCYRHPQASNVVVIDTGAPTLASQRHPAGQGLWRLVLADGRWQITRYELGEGLNWAAKPVVWPVAPGEVSAL